jgi:hypothetical protein
MSIPLNARGASHLECTLCGRRYESERPWQLSPCCEKPLYARYDLDRIRPHFRPSDLAGREPTLWRYAEVLPVRSRERQITLGEGFTPLLPAPRLAASVGEVRDVLDKDRGETVLTIGFATDLHCRWSTPPTAGDTNMRLIVAIGITLLVSASAVAHTVPVGSATGTCQIPRAQDPDQADSAAFLDRLDAVLQRFVNGDANAFKDVWSHTDDVTVAGGFGGESVQGWSVLSPRLSGVADS